MKTSKNNQKSNTMKEEPEFKIRPMKKWELAQMYKPDVSRKSAVHTLKDWIKNNPELGRELRATNYNHRSKELTAVQVELITFYLGKP
jgi:transposase